MESKLQAFDAGLVILAKNLGVRFVQGPGPETVASPVASDFPTNGQDRGTYLFAIAGE